MSDRVALDGQSMHDKRTCDRNAYEPISHIREPILRLEHPFLNRDACDERANQNPEHDNQSTNQIEHFKYIPIVLHMKIKSWII